MALYSVIYAICNGRHRAVIAAESKFFDKSLDILMLIEICIDMLEQVFHNIRFHNAALLLFHDTEIRGEISHCCIGSQQVSTERVYGRDLSTVNKMHLVLQMFVVGRGSESLG